MTINRIVLYLILLNGTLFLTARKPVVDPTAVSPIPTAATTMAAAAAAEPHRQDAHLVETETDFYLRKLFCREALCAGANYAEWIVVDAASQWQVEELQMVRQVLLQTMAALDEVGLNGRSLITGYRFRRFNGPYVDEKEGLIGVVRHNEQEIVLADTAFQRLQGFYIYHELGHVVDYQTHRQLSESYHHLAYGGYQIMEDAAPEEWETASGYWLREQSRHDREEATADAFALWAAFAQSDTRKLIFARPPRHVHYNSIIWALKSSLKALE